MLIYQTVDSLLILLATAALEAQAGLRQQLLLAPDILCCGRGAPRCTSHPAYSLPTPSHSSLPPIPSSSLPSPLPLCSPPSLPPPFPHPLLAPLPSRAEAPGETSTWFQELSLLS